MAKNHRLTALAPGTASVALTTIVLAQEQPGATATRTLAALQLPVAGRVGNVSPVRRGVFAKIGRADLSLTHKLGARSRQSRR